MEPSDLIQIPETDDSTDLYERFEYYRSKGYSIIVSMMCMSWGEFLVGGFFMAINCALQMIAPQFLFKLIENTEVPDAIKLPLQGNELAWMGLWWCIAMFLCSYVGGMLNQLNGHITGHSGVRLRSAIVAACFRKGMTAQLSQIKKKDPEPLPDEKPKKKSLYDSMEEPSVINIISADATQLSGCLPLIHQIWAAPVQLAIASYFLVAIMGPTSAAAGIIVCALCVPVSIYITKKTEVFRIEQLKLSDQRVQLTNEMFMGIKTVKYYHWERVLYDRLYLLRMAELKYTRLFNYFSSASVCASLVIPMMANVATVLVFCLEDRIFWAKIAFTMSAYFGALKGPLLAMGGTVAAVVNTAVALRRVKAWLERPDKPATPTIVSLRSAGIIPEVKGDDDLALYMSHCTFDFPLQTYLNEQRSEKEKRLLLATAVAEPKDQTRLRARSMSADMGPERQHTLNDICIDAKKGEFIAVIGNTGSGKSSLFLSLLGEIPQVSGVIGVDGKFAFVPQSAWILQDTMFNNIVFSNVFDPSWYEEVINACQLQNDFLQLKNGDKTVLGDKGTGLSGGQKQRTSLARAVYARRDIYLLDDVFSALDPATGKKAFEALLGKEGLLRRAKRTVILATNQPQYADGADRMLVLSDHGSVTFFGTPEELRKCTTPEVLLLLKVLEEKAQEALKAEMEAKALAIKTKVGEEPPQVVPAPSPSVTPRTVQRSNTMVAMDNAPPASSMSQFLSLALEPFAQDWSSSNHAGVLVENSHFTNYEEAELSAAYFEKIILESDRRARLNSVDVRDGIPVNVLRSGSMVSLSASTAPGIPDPSGTEGAAALTRGNTSDDWSQQTTGTSAEAISGTAKAVDSAGKGDKKAEKEDNTDNAGIAQEERSQGSVNWATLFVYINSTGKRWFPWLLVFTILAEKATDVYMSFWLVYWTGYEPWSTGQRLYYWLGGYCCIFGFHVVSAIARNLAWAEFAVQAARGMYRQLVGRVLYAPQGFFDVTPIGRILNRFSFDTDMVDVQLIVRIAPFITGLFSCICSIVVTIWLLWPWAWLLLVPSLCCFGLLFKFSRSPMRDLQKLDNVSKSPIQGHMQETLAGIASIRAFECYDRFCQKLDYLTDRNTEAAYNFNSINRWIAVRVETIGDAIQLGAAIIIWLNKEKVSGAFAGIVLLWAVSMTASVGGMISFGTQLEACMTSVERVVSYINLEREPGLEKRRDEMIVPPPEWPNSGSLEFRKVDMCYRPGLPKALKELSCKIESGERVALVGRTGAGKSTISVALFRLAESTSDETGGGGIFLDGLEISRLPLNYVRGKAVAIITQDPVIFSGTIRKNMDPGEDFTDDQIWEALRAVKMHKMIKRSPEGDLSCKVDEGGTNFSVGQRQLLCLARALLKRPKVLVMDEATASLDRASDDFVQKTVRVAFRGCTILTVAHRLLTIADYDKVLVMETGYGIEFGDPHILLTNPQFYSKNQKPGAFRALVDANGSTVAREIEEIAEKRYKMALDCKWEGADQVDTTQPLADDADAGDLESA